MNARRYICTLCNYIYEQPSAEAHKNGALLFEELPEQWTHEECSGSKEAFQPCSCVVWPIYETTIIGHDLAS